MIVPHGIKIKNFAVIIFVIFIRSSEGNGDQ